MLLLRPLQQDSNNIPHLLAAASAECLAGNRPVTSIMSHFLRFLSSMSNMSAKLAKAEGCFELFKAMGTCQSDRFSFLTFHLLQGQQYKKLLNWLKPVLKACQTLVEHSDFVVCAAPCGPKCCGIVLISRTLLGNRPHQQHYKRMPKAASRVMALATFAAFARVPAL